MWCISERMYTDIRHRYDVNDMSYVCTSMSTYHICVHRVCMINIDVHTYDISLIHHISVYMIRRISTHRLIIYHICVHCVYIMCRYATFHVHRYVMYKWENVHRYTTYEHTDTHTHTQILTHTHTLTHTYSHTHILTHVAYVWEKKNVQRYAAYEHTLTHTHTHTHTHAHAITC